MKIPFLSGLKVNGKVELNNLSLLNTPTKILTIDEYNNITYSTSVGGTIDLSNYYNKAQTDTNISNAIANLVSSAPTTLDTLNELAAALGNDPNFATTVTNLIGTKANSSDVYSKSASDARYKAIAWLPSWNEVQSRPTALSQFTNDLGLSSIFQPLENQRLSTSNNVIFNQITANSKLNIPSTSSNKYSLYVDENDLIGGTGSSIPVISYLNDLTDVTISTPINGNVLMYSGGQWINSTVTSGTFDYNALYNKPTNLSQFTNDLGNYGNWVNKSQTDTYYYSINNPSGFITAASLPDLSPYALANGSNASGNWNINIGGTANNAARWNNHQIDLSDYGTSLSFFLGYDNGVGKVRPFSSTQVKLSIGFNDDTNATANTIVRRNENGYINASFFRNTNEYVRGDVPTTITGEDGNGYLYKFNSSAVQAFVGLNNGTTLYNNISGSAGSVNWSNVVSRPTLLSQFTNDLGNYGNWITQSQTNLWYQPLENQRLSSSNNVVFNQITANTKLNIPSTSSNKFSIYIDENGLGGGSLPIPIVANLNDLNDVTIVSPVNGNVLSFDGTQWINSTVTSGTFDYNALYNKPTLLSQFTNDLGNYGNWVTKAQTDTYYYSITNPSGFITSASLPDMNLVHKSIGFLGGYPSADANTVAENTSSFSYSNNAPYNGYLGYFGNGGYGLQLSAQYNGNNLSFRTRNGDGGVNGFNAWNELVFDGLSRTWNLNISGSAATASLAANSTLWRGFAYGSSSLSSAPPQILGYDNAGNINFYTPAAIKLAVNLDDGSTLYNNISGSADKWNGKTRSNTVLSTGYNVSGIYVDLGESVIYPMDKAGINAYLGINNGSTLNNSISGNAFSATNWGDLTYSGIDNSTPLYFMASSGAGVFNYSTIGNVKAALNIGDGSSLNNNITGYSNLLKAVNVYPTVINDSTSAYDLVEGSLTRVDFQENNAAFGGGYANTITTSSYDRYAATQISTMYNALVPRMAIRNYNQSLNNWNNWVEILTTANGNLQRITDIGNTTTNAIGANRFVAGYDSGVANSFNTSNNFRVSGNGGIAWDSVGIYLQSYSSFGVALENGQATVELKMVAGGTTRGYLYADSANNIGFLTNLGSWGLRIDTDGWAYANSFTTGGWFRSAGATGWYNETYAGGVYMEDSTWIRTYNGKGFLAPDIRATNSLQVPAKNSSGANTGNHFSIWVEV